MATLYEEVRATLGESEFRPRKRLGQNFLIHENIIDSIVQLLNLASQDEIVEIGPGLGFLTRRLVDTAKISGAAKTGEIWFSPRQVHKYWSAPKASTH